MVRSNSCHGIQHWRAGSALLAAAVVLALTSTAASAARGRSPELSVAVYQGTPLDLAAGWQGAQACLVWPEVLDAVECFSSEPELEARVVELGGILPGSRALPTAGPAIAGPGRFVATGSSCSSFVRLYDGIYYTGASLWLNSRSIWLNLSALGFDQRTSSFKIGACSAYFADWAGGGGAWYPTWATQAYDVAPWMASGWNNDVSSVFII